MKLSEAAIWSIRECSTLKTKVWLRSSSVCVVFSPSPSMCFHFLEFLIYSYFGGPLWSDTADDDEVDGHM